MKKPLLLLLTILTSTAGVSRANLIYLVDFRNDGTSAEITNATAVNLYSSGQNQVVAFNDPFTLNDTTNTSTLTLGSFAASSTAAGDVITVNRSLADTTTDDAATRPSWTTKEANFEAPTALGPSGGTTTLTFTVSGLAANAEVNVGMVSSYFNNAGGNTSWNISINGVTTGDSASFNGYTNGRDAIDYADLNWSGITANASGELNFEMNTGDRRIALNAMRIEVIPEPSSLMLLGVCGVAGALSLRRRR